LGARGKTGSTRRSQPAIVPESLGVRRPFVLPPEPQWTVWDLQSTDTKNTAGKERPS
jgi:hypothetical protein